MSTVELKSNLYKLIDSINDSKTLNAIYTLLSKKEAKNIDWWDGISSKEKAAIEEGLAQAERGEVVSHEDVMKASHKLISKYKK